jgi:hypothetical protein
MRNLEHTISIIIMAQMVEVIHTAKNWMMMKTQMALVKLIRTRLQMEVENLHQISHNQHLIGAIHYLKALTL